MLGYISSTRKKSCYCCVKAKRRCDLGYPSCKRCLVKRLDCEYPNAARKSSTQQGDLPTEVVLRQATPDLNLPTTNKLSSLVSEGIPDSITSNVFPNRPFIFQPSASPSSPEFYTPLQNALPLGVPPPTQLTRPLTPSLKVPCYLNAQQVLSIITSLSAIAPSLASTGCTTFLHRNLYITHPAPSAYLDAVALCALYVSKTPRTIPILSYSMSAKIAALVERSGTWTLRQHLAAVQALIVYQTIRLFDPDLGLQGEGERCNGLLETWAGKLWKRFSSEMQTESSYEAYIFAESLRRTILISVFTRCAYGALMRDGQADYVHVLTRLPLERDVQAWSCEAVEWEGRRNEGRQGGLVSYGDFAGMWNAGARVQTLGEFERVLLVACWGKEDVRLLWGGIE
jgi:hypothetical protein